MHTHTHIYTFWVPPWPKHFRIHFLFVFSFCVCVLFCFSHTHTRIFVFHFCAHRCDWRCRAKGSYIRLHKAPLKTPIAVVVGAPTLAQIIWAAPSSMSSSDRPNIQTFHISFCLSCRLLYVRRKYKVRVSLCVCVGSTHTDRQAMPIYTIYVRIV